MHKFRLLTVLGFLVCLIAPLIIGLNMSGDNESRIPFIVFGIIMGIVIMGLGEILYYLSNGEKK